MASPLVVRTVSLVVMLFAAAHAAGSPMTIPQQPLLACFAACDHAIHALPTVPGLPKEQVLGLCYSGCVLAKATQPSSTRGYGLRQRPKRAASGIFDDIQSALSQAAGTIADAGRKANAADIESALSQAGDAAKAMTAQAETRFNEALVDAATQLAGPGVATVRGAEAAAPALEDAAIIGAEVAI